MNVNLVAVENASGAVSLFSGGAWCCDGEMLSHGGWMQRDGLLQRGDHVRDCFQRRPSSYSDEGELRRFCVRFLLRSSHVVAAVRVWRWCVAFCDVAVKMLGGLVAGGCWFELQQRDSGSGEASLELTVSGGSF